MWPRWRRPAAIRRSRAGSTTFRRPYTRADARAYVAACRRGWKEGSLWAFAVIDAASGEVVGSCGIGWQDHPHGVAEIGYWVRAGDRGRGVATRAVRLASEWAFEEGGVQRLQLRADELNIRLAARRRERRLPA